MQETLGIRVVQMDHEPVWSLVQRLAELHGHSDAGSFCREYNLESRRFAKEREDVVRLAELCEFDPEKLVFSSPIRREGRSFQVGAERIDPIGALGFQFRKIHICPICLAEDQSVGSGRKELRSYYRTWWSFPLFTNCPLHNVQMLSRCPSSGVYLDPRKPDPRFCGGEIDLSFEAGIPADAGFERYILGRLGYGPRIEIDMLDELTFSEVQIVVPRTGHAVLSGVNILFDPVADPIQMRRCVAEGWEILSRGRNGFDQFLEELMRAGKNSDGMSTIAGSFGKYYSWLHQEQRFSKSNFKAVADAMFDYCRSTFCVGAEGSILGTKLEKQEVYRMRAAAEKLGMAVPDLRVVLRHLNLHTHHKNTQPLVSATDLTTIQAFKATLMRGTEFCFHYGMSPQILRTLRLSGLVKPALQRGRKGLGLGLTLSDGKQFFDNLIGEAALVEEMDPDDIQLSRISLEYKIDVVTTVKLLISGRLKCSGVVTGKKQFEAVMVSRSALREIICPGYDQHCDSQAVVKALHTQHPTLRALVNEGHLHQYELQRALTSKIPLRLFRKDEVEKFGARFVTRKRAGIELNDTDTGLSFAELNLSPALILRGQKSTNFYSRSEISAAVRNMSRVDRKTGK